jgi:branched-chain amino acid transport system ATP-binding protein
VTPADARETAPTAPTAPGGAPATPAILELIGIRAGYGTIDVLHGLSFRVESGQIVALLGANGAGKTTTLAVASGQIRPSSGSVMLAGREVTGAAPDALARAGVCLVPEGRGIFPNLTVTENLRMATYSGTPYKDVLERAFEQFPRLKERRHQHAGTLSGGEQQMLAMSRALATDPVLLMLDELSMGLAPLIVEELYERVAEFARHGGSILIVEQFAQAVLGVAHHALVMAHGRIERVGPPAEIAEHLAAAYLGMSS